MPQPGPAGNFLPEPLAILLAAQLQLAAPAPGGVDPREVLRVAVRAVEADSVRARAAAWSARLARDSTDAAARFGLASLARLTHRYPSALSAFAAIRALPAATSGRFAPFAALGAAQSLSTTGRYAEAGTEFAAAVALARQARDTAAEVLGLLGLAGQRLRTADPSVARALFDSAERVLPPRDLQLRAAHRCGRAALFARTARPEAVSEAFTGAALARRVGDRRQESACLLIAANGQVRLGKLREATVLFDRITAQLRKLYDRAGLATVLQWSGYTAFTQEQHDRAQRLLGQAIREAEASSNVSALAWSLLDLARVSLALADPVSAAEQTDRAIGLLRQLGDQWGVTTALGLQAQLAFDIGDTARAGLLLVELAEGAVRDNDAVAEAEVQIALAALALHRRDRTATSEALDRARRAMLRAGRSALQASLPYQRGVVALRWGDFAGARRLFRTVLEATDTGQRITRYLAEAPPGRGQPATG